MRCFSLLQYRLVSNVLGKIYLGMLITSEQWLQIDLLEQSSDESVKSTRLSAEHRYNGKVQLTEI